MRFSGTSVGVTPVSSAITRRTAKHLGRAYNTIKNEIARGTVYLYNGKVARYKAKAGEQQYKDNRRNSRRQYKRLEVYSFINYVEEWFAKGWSLDASVGKALKSGKFHRWQIVCTKTLYNYVDNGLIGIKNIDLPEKLKRNTKKEKVRKHKRVLGDSIELRPESVELREEFGHWEVDTVLGSKYEDEPCTVTMTERKTRNSIWIKAANHTVDAVQKAIQSIMDYFGIKASTVFKSVTGDNGSEFARLAELASQGTSVYFTHPYSSWEKGTNECHNRLLRRFIPKGVSVWQGTRQKTLLTWPIGPIRCREKSWATGHRRKNKPPSQRSSLVKIIATCYCNSLKYT